MNNAAALTGGDGSGCEIPSDLYIYYLSGRFPQESRMPKDGFLGNWEEDDTSFLFFSRPADAEVERLVAAAGGVVALEDSYRMPYAEWQGGLPAVQAIGSFTIVTPWADAPPRGDRVLVIDPGVVFGTGRHPTTNDCLSALETAFSRQRIRQMMDLGTGTGILAVAGACLGCPRVLAVDRNRLAAATALGNVRRNHFQKRVVVAAADALAMADLTSDLLVANIHYAVMRQLVGRRTVLTGKRAFILSGLLRSEARDIRYILNTMGVKILREWHRDDIWFTFYAEPSIS